MPQMLLTISTGQFLRLFELLLFQLNGARTLFDAYLLYSVGFSIRDNSLELLFSELYYSFRK